MAAGRAAALRAAAVSRRYACVLGRIRALPEAHCVHGTSTGGGGGAATGGIGGRRRRSRGGGHRAEGGACRGSSRGGGSCVRDEGGAEVVGAGSAGEVAMG
jgi:hypothetical protein